MWTVQLLLICIHDLHRTKCGDEGKELLEASFLVFNFYQCSITYNNLETSDICYSYFLNVWLNPHYLSTLRWHFLTREFTDESHQIKYILCVKVEQTSASVRHHHPHLKQ